MDVKNAAKNSGDFLLQILISYPTGMSLSAWLLSAAEGFVFLTVVVVVVVVVVAEVVVEVEVAVVKVFDDTVEDVCEAVVVEDEFSP